jgi:hypothetical protein
MKWNQKSMESFALQDGTLFVFLFWCIVFRPTNLFLNQTHSQLYTRALLAMFFVRTISKTGEIRTLICCSWSVCNATSPLHCIYSLRIFLKRLPGAGSEPGSSRFHLFSHFHHFTAEPQRLPIFVKNLLLPKIRLPTFREVILAT